MKVSIDQQLASLPTMLRKALQAMWEELFGKPPNPALRRELLIPILAYRIQEKAYGGLKRSTARRLRKIADEIRTGKRRTRTLEPRPGTRMVLRKKNN